MAFFKNFSVAENGNLTENWRVRKRKFIKTGGGKNGNSEISSSKYGNGNVLFLYRGDKKKK